MKLNVVILLLIVAFCCGCATELAGLDGSWRFRMDPDDKGQSQQWYLQKFTDTVQLPGTMDQNQKGNANNNRNFTMHLSRPLVTRAKPGISVIL